MSKMIFLFLVPLISNNFSTIATLKPNLLALLVEIVARLRWDDASVLPLTRVSKLGSISVAVFIS